MLKHISKLNSTALNGIVECCLISLDSSADVNVELAINELSYSVFRVAVDLPHQHCLLLKP